MYGVDWSKLGGKFITLEGIDGSGKSTQARLLANFARFQGLDVVDTVEPTYEGPFGKIIREYLTRKREGASSRSRIMMAAAFVADRAWHVAEVIAPALAEGKLVICDRYILSSLAYQPALYSRDEEERERTRFYALMDQFPVPDLTLFLDLPPTNAIARLQARATSEELDIYETTEQLARVRESYSHAMGFLRMWDPRWVFRSFDASQAVVSVRDQVRDAVQTLVEE